MKVIRILKFQQKRSFPFLLKAQDTLNVNQINTILNWDRYAYRLKFNKH